MGLPNASNIEMALNRLKASKLAGDTVADFSQRRFLAEAFQHYLSYADTIPIFVTVVANCCCPAVAVKSTSRKVGLISQDSRPT